MINRCPCCRLSHGALRALPDPQKMHVCWSEKQDFECVIWRYEIRSVYHLQRTFVLISFWVSVKKTDELLSLAEILMFVPCNAGRNVECNSAGLGWPKVSATTPASRKYGSWSIAHGTRHGTYGCKKRFWLYPSIFTFRFVSDKP